MTEEEATKVFDEALSALIPYYKKIEQERRDKGVEQYKNENTHIVEELDGSSKSCARQRVPEVFVCEGEFKEHLL